MKPLMVVHVLGFGYLAIAFKLSLLGHTPFDETLCFKYLIFSLKNSDFEGLSFSLCNQNHSSIACNRLQHHRDKLNMLSSSALPDSWSSNVGRWLACCTTQRACVHTEKNLSVPTVKAIYCLEDSSMGVCQNLERRSTVV